VTEAAPAGTGGPGGVEATSTVEALDVQKIRRSGVQKVFVFDLLIF
jgi:hypothetical protein